MSNAKKAVPMQVVLDKDGKQLSRTAAASPELTFQPKRSLLLTENRLLLYAHQKRMVQLGTVKY